MTIRPTRDQFLIEPLVMANDKVRGIHIPEAHRERQPSIDCLVIAKGPKATADVNVGDRVLVERFQGTDVKVKDKSFKLVTAKELLAIIE